MPGIYEGAMYSPGYPDAWNANNIFQNGPIGEQLNPGAPKIWTVGSGGEAVQIQAPPNASPGWTPSQDDIRIAKYCKDRGLGIPVGGMAERAAAARAQDGGDFPGSYVMVRGEKLMLPKGVTNCSTFDWKGRHYKLFAKGHGWEAREWPR